MNYSKFSVEDFVNDEYFRHWVLKPGAKSQKFWQDWLKRNPSKKEVVEQARKIVSQFEFNTFRPAEEDVEEVWENIKTAIDEPTSGIKLSRERSYRKYRGTGYRHVIRKVAASLVLLVVTASLLYLNSDLIFYKEYTTDYSEMESVTLPDDTKVTLSANSVLKIKRPWFSELPREVWLTGRAYFAVAKRLSEEGEKMNFTVHTNDLQVEVLGTQFTVNTRREKTRVVLTEGKVRLDLEGEDEEDIYMSPGDLVEFSSANERLTLQKVDPAPYVSWKENKLIFDEVTLREIADQLEDQHGLKVIFEEEALEVKKFRGTFEVDKINVLLQAIAESFEIEITKKGKLITMKSK